MSEFVRCVVEERQAVYVSAPVTSGPRYLRWLSEKRDAARPAAELEREVIQPNRERGRELASRVRQRFTSWAVIDPTAVRLPGDWKLREYHELWERVIRRYARLVVFSDGWEYSYGCAYEFLASCRAGLEVLDERFEPLTPNAAAARIRSAVADYQAAGVDTTFFTELLPAVTLLCDREGRG